MSPVVYVMSREDVIHCPKLLPPVSCTQGIIKPYDFVDVKFAILYPVSIVLVGGIPRLKLPLCG